MEIVSFQWRKLGGTTLIILISPVIGKTGVVYSYCDVPTRIQHNLCSIPAKGSYVNVTGNYWAIQDFETIQNEEQCTEQLAWTPKCHCFERQKQLRHWRLREIREIGQLHASVIPD